MSAGTGSESEIRRALRGRFRRWTARHRDPLWWLSAVCHSPASIVQIGANDGMQEDIVARFLKRHPESQAVFVEPVPYLFERLEKSVSRFPGSRAINCAVNEGSDAEFYWVDPVARTKHPDLPDWIEQLGSFDRAHILGHLSGALEPFVQSSTVRGMRLMDLLAETGWSGIDLLHVDCEGYDWRVVSQLDFARTVPRVVWFEHKHLSAADKSESIAFLKTRYAVFDLGSDILALERSAFARAPAQATPFEALFFWRLLPPSARRRFFAHCLPGRPL